MRKQMIRLQAEHIKILLNSRVELLRDGVGGAELDFVEWSSPKHPLKCELVENHFYVGR